MRQTCGRQARFGVQLDMLIISVHMVVDLGPIEQIYDVLSVGHEFHMPENLSLWHTAADAMRVELITNGRRMRAIGPIRVKPIQRHSVNREATM